jgi:hypothetical protein
MRKFCPVFLFSSQEAGKQKTIEIKEKDQRIAALGSYPIIGG